MFHAIDFCKFFIIILINIFIVLIINSYQYKLVTYLNKRTTDEVA